MSIRVDSDWWKTMFDEVYLLTDARSVCDPDLTRREVDLICELIPILPDHRILDLCGGHGRHSIELCRRGFLNCTLVDYSQYLTDHARTLSLSHNCRMDIICSDARETGLPPNSFDHVCILGNSLGYQKQKEADRRIFDEARRLLCPDGWILVDVTDGAVVRKAFSPVAWHEIEDDIVVCRQRRLSVDRIEAREMVLSKEKGLIRDNTYSIRLYDAAGLEDLLKQAGFKQVQVYTGHRPHRDGGDYGFMNHRMVGIGQKI